MRTEWRWWEITSRIIHSIIHIISRLTQLDPLPPPSWDPSQSRPLTTLSHCSTRDTPWVKSILRLVFTHPPSIVFTKSSCQTAQSPRVVIPASSALLLCIMPNASLGLEKPIQLWMCPKSCGRQWRRTSQLKQYVVHSNGMGWRLWWRRNDPSIRKMGNLLLAAFWQLFGPSRQICCRQICRFT